MIKILSAGLLSLETSGFYWTNNKPVKWVIVVCSYLPGENTKDIYICSRRNWVSTQNRFIMGYQLDKPKPKAQEILWTRNSQGIEKKSHHTHTRFSSKPSPGIYWGTRQKEAGPDEPLGWVSTVILKYLSEETWNYYFSPKLEKTPFSPLRGKRFPICQCGCLFQSKGGTWTLLTSLSTYIYCESLSLQQWSTF